VSTKSMWRNVSENMRAVDVKGNDVDRPERATGYCYRNPPIHRMDDAKDETSDDPVESDDKKTRKTKGTLKVRSGKTKGFQ
jgi:hypothetical protein